MAKFKFSTCWKEFICSFILLTLSSKFPFCGLLISLYNKTPSLTLSKTSLLSGALGIFFLQTGSSAKKLLITLT